MIGSDHNASCDEKVMVIVSACLAYQELLALFELNVVVPVSDGNSLSILICVDVFIDSVLFNLSLE